MNEPRSETLIEATLSAHRDRDASGRVLPSGAWLDLTPDEREAAFEALTQARRLEAASAEDGLSTTSRAVLTRALSLAQL